MTLKVSRESSEVASTAYVAFYLKYNINGGVSRIFKMQIS